MALEKEYPELFRLVRTFEGTIRNMGCHASGVLVTPCDVIDYFPVRYDKEKGVVALFTGPQLESLGAIKLDILGLKTLDVFDKTIKAINPKMTVNDLYNIVEKHYTDKKMSSIPGRVTDPANPEPGCPFAPRCSFAKESCVQPEYSCYKVQEADHE